MMLDNHNFITIEPSLSECSAHLHALADSASYSVITTMGISPYASRRIFLLDHRTFDINIIPVRLAMTTARALGNKKLLV